MHLLAYEASTFLSHVNKESNLLSNPHVMGVSSVHRIIGSKFLFSFKALWSPLLSSNTTYATLNPCKVHIESNCGFREAFLK